MGAIDRGANHRAALEGIGVVLAATVVTLAGGSMVSSATPTRSRTQAK